jgi:hypothetical protein
MFNPRLNPGIEIVLDDREDYLPQILITQRYKLYLANILFIKYKKEIQKMGLSSGVEGSPGRLKQAAISGTRITATVPTVTNL